jgi:thiol-disulfide isomerase/thioredoxin
VLRALGPLACASAIFLPCAGASAELVGTPAPVCDLSPLAGSERIDMRDFHGKVLYVDFWASWCGPCAKAFPFMNAMDRDYRGRGLRILGINVDEKVEDAHRFLARSPASFALAADASGRCPRAFSVEAMPSSYLVDRAGVVRYVHRGFRPAQAAQLRTMVEALLSERTGGSDDSTPLAR